MYARDASSSDRCCCKLGLFFLLTAALLGAVVVVFALTLSPEKPQFSLHSISINGSRISTDSDESSGLMLLVATNPNKFGIRYYPSALAVSSDKSPIGTIRSPEFYQPPHSENVSLKMRLFFKRPDLVGLIHEESFPGPHKGAEITGRVEARLHVLSFPLPKMKIDVRCRIRIRDGSITISRTVEELKRRKAIHLSNFRGVSLKCSWDMGR